MSGDKLHLDHQTLLHLLAQMVRIRVSHSDGVVPEISALISAYLSISQRRSTGEVPSLLRYCLASTTCL